MTTFIATRQAAPPSAQAVEVLSEVGVRAFTPELNEIDVTEQRGCR
jgi:hypothetical protein